MISLDPIYQQLQEQGFRLTDLRRRLIRLFADSSQPLSANEALRSVAKTNGVNKTTIYRELIFLQAQGLIKPIHYDEKEMRYEWAGDHHHHLVCRSCKIVEDIDLPALEKAVHQAQKRITSQARFSLLDHSLEFFGLCQQCQ